jgi:hypothetical protein
MWFLLGFLIMAAVPDGRGGVGAAIVPVGLAVLGGLMIAQLPLMLTIVFFNRPKFLVPPYARQEMWVFEEWSLRRSTGGGGCRRE